MHTCSWIVYRLNHTPPLCQPLSTQKPLETLPARRDNKPISANNAVTQLSLRIVLADQDMLPKSLWILLAAGEVWCVTARHSKLLCQREDYRNGCLLLRGYKIPGDFGPVISLEI